MTKEKTMKGRWLVLTALAAGALVLAGCAGAVDLNEMAKDYTFQPVGPVGIPMTFYDNDESLKHWYAMPYVNPYD
jgi:hypothetical protein